MLVLMAHILQSLQWAQFRLKTPNVKKVLTIGQTRVYIHRIPHLPFTIAYLPRPETFDNLEEIKRACQKENALFLKIEPASLARGGLAKLNEMASGRAILPQHTIYIDLTKPEEELLRNMHEKTRYNIRLAQKKGVVVKENDDIESFIKLLSQTENRQGFYSHYANYYRNLWNVLRPANIVHLLSAYLPNHLYTSHPIASIMLFHYGDFLYYPYGGSDPKFKEYMAPNLLHWAASKLGKRLGCKTYDLWGSYKNSKDETDPWYGIYRFKSGFGGTEIDFPSTVDVPLSPLYPLFSFVDSLRWKFLKLVR